MESPQSRHRHRDPCRGINHSEKKVALESPREGSASPGDGARAAPRTRKPGQLPHVLPTQAVFVPDLRKLMESLWKPFLSLGLFLPMCVNFHQFPLVSVSAHYFALICVAYPVLPFLGFLDFPGKFKARNFLGYLGVFPAFSRVFGGSAGRENPW